MVRRVPQPPESGCRIFEGPQLSENWLQLRFLDGLSLPRSLRFTWSTFGSLSFITKCLKTAFPLRSPPLTVLNSGKLPQGFVLEQNSISFSLKTCISSSRRIVLNSGKQGFLSNLQKIFIFILIGSWCPGRHSICPLLFLQPLSEGCGTRLTIRNKDQKNSDCKTRWLVYMKWAQM